MKKVTGTGKTVDEAVENALVELDATRDEVEITVVEEPNKGLFGFIGSKEATVEVAKTVDAVEQARQFLLSVFATMNVDLSVETIEKEDHTVLNIEGDELGIVIGRRGQTLDSFQYLTNVVANRYSDSSIRIVLDGENYRQRRRKTLEELADRLAEKVLRTKQDVKLEPMSPMDRKVIHTRLQHREDVMTSSVGRDLQRRVVISLHKPSR